MANVKVRLKDASNNVLHPETDWSVVQNKPSITMFPKEERWYSIDKQITLSGLDVDLRSTTLKLHGANKLQVSDQYTGRNYVDLANYPIKWSAISNKPSYVPTNIKDIIFGRYSTVAETPDGTGYAGMVYPAIRTINYSSNPSGDNYGYTCFYFNGTSWTKFTDNSKFIPGI